MYLSPIASTFPLDIYSMRVTMLSSRLNLHFGLSDLKSNIYTQELILPLFVANPQTAASFPDELREISEM